MRQIGKLFMEETKFQKLEASNQMKGYRQPPLEMEIDHDAGIIDLPGRMIINAAGMQFSTQ